MKKFLKYFFLAYVLLSVVFILNADGDVNREMLGSMTFGISFLGWLLLVTDKGSRRVEI